MSATESTSLLNKDVQKRKSITLGSLYLENTGAVARDHLANERTFLAWMRTSFSTISVGVGITQLFRLQETAIQRIGQLLGVGFILMGALYLALGCTRFFHAQSAMTKGYFPATRGIIMTTFGVTLAALTILLVIVQTES
ncbi:hypothetical protein O0I10_011404 [Lichtheimia ornata]|uniref:DUF202 domain-containing protein n=1 Tax=Lichtheimia ornata TaxID=688661 RepID=A0AAD7XWS5_9FUNG|nr:uncharacterized protein O0I10_011404 [Lichtheimia ornata]KAJ8652942.1 hypothetical protein O0I10_011404 [Lichtheimia ornata]